MIVEGAAVLPGRPEAVWDLLLDPDVIAKAMPGAKELTRAAPDHYRGRMVVGVGPITAAEFSLDIRISEQERPRRFVMQVDATGHFGFTQGRAEVTLEPEGEETRMAYRADLRVGGKIASVGQRLLDVVSRMMLRSGLDALQQEVARRLTAGGPSA